MRHKRFLQLVRERPTSALCRQTYDISDSGIDLVADIAEIFAIHDIKTEIISASIRAPQDVTDSAKAGAHIATVQYKVIVQMSKHPLTDVGIAKFMEDWNKTFN